MFQPNKQKIEDDLQKVELKIKWHKGNLKLLKSQSKKIDKSIHDLEVELQKYCPLPPPNTSSDNHPKTQNEEDIMTDILWHENSAASILCQLKLLCPTEESNLLSLTKDVLGIVATLGKVDDANLSRLLSEYLGSKTMLAIVCRTYEGVKALETYDKEGCIDKESGLHGLSTSVGRVLNGRFLIICLENLRPYCGELVPNNPQRKLDLLKPRLPNGDCPPGFIGFAVNMFDIEFKHLYCLTPSGHGLRETLFYNLFSNLQIYKSRADMMHALPYISDAAVSLDGGIIKSTGVFALGNRNDIDIVFSKPSGASSASEKHIETEKKLFEMKWAKEKVMHDIKREQALLSNAKTDFERKNDEFAKYSAVNSSYTIQMNVEYSLRKCLRNRELGRVSIIKKEAQEPSVEDLDKSFEANFGGSQPCKLYKTEPCQGQLCSVVRKAVEGAAIFKSRYPMFKVFLRGTSLKVLFVPKNFFLRHMKIGTQQITLRVRYKRWPVKLNYNDEHNFQCSLGAGWPAFAKCNFLQLGDICTFELISKDPAVLKVSIFSHCGFPECLKAMFRFGISNYLAGS